MRALLSLFLIGCTTTSAAGEARVDEGPVIIELFTSQGCNSCPAADAIVNRIAQTHQLGGRQVVPLAFHVDYWDYLGWADPYASAAWTDRQQDYGRVLKDRVYTPELIVAGSVGMVGSHGTRVAQAIAGAPRQQRIRAAASWDKSSITVEATAPATADVWVAIWEDGTKTSVPRGENAGETLAGDHVVRRLERIAAAGQTVKRTIKLDPRWGSAIGAVAFAQQADRKIIGAAMLPRGGKNGS